MGGVQLPVILIKKAWCLLQAQTRTFRAPREDCKISNLKIIHGWITNISFDPIDHTNAGNSLKKLPVPKNIRIAQRLIDQVMDVRSKRCGVWLLVCERDRGRYRTLCTP